MGILDLLKKKPKLDLPPPPAGLEQQLPPSDLPEISGRALEQIEIPEAPPELAAEAEQEAEEAAPEVPAPKPPVAEKPALPKLTPAERPEARQLPLKPVFVSVQDYQAIVDSANAVRDKLTQAEDLFKQLSALKTAEEKELDLWRQHLEDMEKKLAYVDDVIFQAQG